MVTRTSTRRAGDGFRSGVVLLGLIAGAVVVLGAVVVVERNETRDVTFTVASAMMSGQEERPYGIVLDDGQQLIFRRPTGLVAGDEITVRYDRMGRLAGTVRHGEYLPRANQPSPLVFFVPLATGLLLGAITVYLAAAGGLVAAAMAVPRIGVS
jgi:hypothetical protein